MKFQNFTHPNLQSISLTLSLFWNMLPHPDWCQASFYSSQSEAWSVVSLNVSLIHVSSNARVPVVLELFNNPLDRWGYFGWEIIKIIRLQVLQGILLGCFWKTAPVKKFHKTRFQSPPEHSFSSSCTNYILSTHLMHFKAESPFSAIYCISCRTQQSHHSFLLEPLTGHTVMSIIWARLWRTSVLNKWMAHEASLLLELCPNLNIISVSPPTLV